MAKGKVCRRYSESFKRQVVTEYEDGASASALCRKYGIGSVSSVTGWVQQYGREGLRHKIMHIQTPDEADQLRQLEREREVLQQAVAELTVKNLLLEGELRVYRETYGEEGLKKNGPASSHTLTRPARDT
jgi:transposase-like protein